MALLIGYFGKLDLAPGKFPDVRFSRIRFWATLMTVSCAVVFWSLGTGCDKELARYCGIANLTAYYLTSSSEG